MKKKFSEVYHLSCESVEGLLQGRLGRPLTKVEQSSIWNTGSLHLLETFERDIMNAQSIEEVLALLKQQEQVSAKALEHALDSLVERIVDLIHRSLVNEEEQKLRSIQVVEEAMKFAETLIEAPVDQREVVFQDMIGHL